MQTQENKNTELGVLLFNEKRRLISICRSIIHASVLLKTELKLYQFCQITDRDGLGYYVYPFHKQYAGIEDLGKLTIEEYLNRFDPHIREQINNKVSAEDNNPAFIFDENRILIEVAPSLKNASVRYGEALSFSNTFDAIYSCENRKWAFPYREDIVEEEEIGKLPLLIFHCRSLRWDLFDLIYK